MSRSGRAAPAAAAWLAVFLSALGAPAEAQTGSAPPALRLAELEKQADVLEKRLAFVVDQYGRESLLSDLDEAERRFSESEIHYLLEDYGATAVLLYDVVDSPGFQRSERYPDALYYLADSLYRQQSYMPARQFFLRLLERGGSRHRQDALVRLIEIAGKLGDYGDVDGLFRSLAQSGATIKSRVHYVYGKFLHARRDLPAAQRIPQALDSFGRVPESSSLYRAARYFIGVLHVQDGRHEQALEAFRAVTGKPSDKARQQRIIELAWLAQGRLLFELGSYDDAIDAYQHVERTSEHFYQSLYEIAWVYVKKGEFDLAVKACDLLLVGAAETPLAPEASILMGNLRARERKYDAALDTYNEVINTYAPVRDEIDALLALHSDPVSYFNQLIAREGGKFEVDSLLPPVAVKWASTETDVEHALGIVGDVEAGRTGVVEGQAIADRILASLESGTLEPFPTLSEGRKRAVEIQNGLLQLQSRIAALAVDLVGVAAGPEVRGELEAARREREGLETRISALPSDEKAQLARVRQWAAKVEQVEKEIWRIKIGNDSLVAQIVAMHKYLRDTKGKRETVEEEEILRRLELEKEVVDQFQLEAAGLLQDSTLLEDSVRSGTVEAGEQELRVRYQAALAREREVLGRARAGLGGALEGELGRAEGLAQRGAGMLGRVDAFLADVERRAAQRREAIRQQVLTERSRLESYGGEVQAVMGDTRDLVGRIALESFRRVQGEFYQLILKADVGIIDVAWARKSDKSTEIQRLAQEKDRQLRHLDRDFAEVLEEGQ